MSGVLRALIMSCIKTYSEKRFEQKSKFTLRLSKDIITVSKPDPLSGKSVNASEVIGEYFGSFSLALFSCTIWETVDGDLAGLVLAQLKRCNDTG